MDFKRVLFISAVLGVSFCSATNSTFEDSGILYANCLSNGTIPIEFVCDDKIDCDDRSDEDCTEGLGTLTVTCRSNETIQHSLVCDGKPDCIDGSDELGCRSEILRTDFLLVADEGQRNIFQVNLTTGDIRPVYPVKASPKIYPKTMDYIPAKRTMYYISQRKFSECNIVIHSIDGVQREAVPCTYNKNLDFKVITIAVDNDRNGYINSPIIPGNIVKVPLYEPSGYSVFLAAAGKTIQAITYNIERSVLYYSVCDDRNYRIDRAVRGIIEKHETIVSKLGSCASAIAVDFSGGVFYWAEESGDLRTANLNGGNQRLINQNPRASYVGLALDNEFLYISDSNNRCIQKLDRNTSIMTNLTGPVFVKPGNISIHSSHYTYQDNQDQANVDEPGSASTSTIVVVSVVVCVSVIVIVLTIGIIVFKMKSKARTNTEYEQNVPVPYGYDGHYDTIGEDPKGSVYEDIKDSEYYDVINEDEIELKIQSDYLHMSDTREATKSENLYMSDTSKAKTP